MSQCGHVPNGTRTLFNSSSYEYLHGIRILNLLEKKIVNLIEGPHFLVKMLKKFHEFFRLFCDILSFFLTKKWTVVPVCCKCAFGNSDFSSN